MSNQELSQLFGQIADLMEIKGENRFKILAYRRASDSIKEMIHDLSTLPENDLIELPGIGQALAEKIVEFSETGKLNFLSRLEEEVPPSLIDLLSVPDLGPKKASLFWKSLNISSLEEVEQAARSGKLRSLPGMGEKSEARILAGIKTLQRSNHRFPIHEAEKIADEWKQRIQKLIGVQCLEIAGSLRRLRPTIGDLDLVGCVESSQTVMDFFTSQPEVTEVLSHGSHKSSVRLNSGFTMQLWLQPKEKFGSLLQFVTGSKSHNVRLREYALKQGLSLSERGFVTRELKEILCENEEMVYATLGLQFIPPEMRQDRGEIAAAALHKLPELVTETDFVSDLHTHTKWSEGRNTIFEMAEAAFKKGLSMLAVTDHTPSAPTQNKLDTLSIDEIAAQAEEVSKVQKKMGPEMRILHGIEVDILPNGQLDFPDDVLSRFDLVVASIHLEADQSREQATHRLLAAIRNPHVDIIGHPSGRELPFTNGSEADWETIFQAASETGTALEINSNPIHLDLDDSKARRAAEMGVLIAVNSDAHSADDLGNLKYGIGTARRAWLSKENIINTWSPRKINAWLKTRRGTI